MLYNVVIDLEMCRVKNFRSKGAVYKHALEIIQIGAVLLDSEFETICTFNEYVKAEFGVIDGFIKNLTGINSSQMKNGKALKEALDVPPISSNNDFIMHASFAGSIIAKEKAICECVDIKFVIWNRHICLLRIYCSLP